MADEVYNYAHCTTGTLVKTGPGVLHSVMVSAQAANGSVTIYDETSASGDVILVMTTVQNRSESCVLDVAFGVGLYVVPGGVNANATVSYR